MNAARPSGAMGAATRWAMPASVRGWLVLLAGVATVSVVLVGAFGVSGTLAAQREAKRTFEQGVLSVSHLGDLREALSRLARHEMDAIVNFESPPLTDEAKRAWEAALALAIERADGLRQGDREAADADADLVGQIDALRKGLASYADGFREVVTRMERGEVFSAGVGNQLMLPHRQGLMDAARAVNAVQEAIKEQTARRRALVDLSISDRVWAGGAVGLVGVLLTLFAGTLTMRSIAQPLSQAQGVTQRIAAGKLDAEVVPSRCREMQSLLMSLQTMQDELRDLVAGLQEATHEVFQASTEIAAGSHTLKLGTDQVRLRIQDSSNALREVDQSAHQIATDSGRAVGLAARSSQVAAEGGAAMDEVVRGMDGIAQATTRIADMSTTIEGIAAQSNLLGLNAAVEAARAGVHGKGFSVVAEEVRTLAQRSATAAGEIRSVASAAEERVRIGADAVVRANAAMQDVMRAVREVQVLVEGMAEATSDQARRLVTVGDAMRDIDHATTVNAGLCVQSDEAAQTLHALAQRVDVAVRRFEV